MYQSVIGVWTNVIECLFVFNVGQKHRYLLYTRWCIPHCGQAKIDVRSQALVVPMEWTWTMIVSVFCIAKMDKVDYEPFFMQLKSI